MAGPEIKLDQEEKKNTNVLMVNERLLAFHVVNIDR